MEQKSQELGMVGAEGKVFYIFTFQELTSIMQLQQLATKLGVELLG